jgi:hypothetical protein
LSHLAPSLVDAITRFLRHHPSPLRRSSKLAAQRLADVPPHRVQRVDGG